MTLVVAWVGLLAIHKAPTVAVRSGVALHYALSDPVARTVLTRDRWTHFGVTPLDPSDEMVGFYRGSRLLAAVTLHRGSAVTVDSVQDVAHEPFAFGSGIANDLRVLVLLAVVFVLATAVWPMWRMRNLDVLVAASLVASVDLFNRGLLSWEVFLSYAALGYLAIRSAWWALRSHRPGRRSIPLLDHLAAGWSGAQRLRLLRLVAWGCALILVMVGLTSPNVIDVGYAVMEGATGITHGLLPYGHIANVFHGDTYPIGSYLLYVPAAWFLPVLTSWDNAGAVLFVAVGAALLAAWGLSRLPLSWGNRALDPEARSARLSTVIAWMTFPPLLVTVSTGTTDVALAAILVGALVLWRRPGWSTGALACGAWFKLTPLAIMPLWLARLRGSELRRAMTAILLVSVPMVAVVIALGGWTEPAHMVRALTFQFTRSSPHTLWGQVGSTPWQQLIQAATVALVVAGMTAIRRDHRLAEDLPRMAALSAAVLIGLQLSGSYWNYMYLVWVAPLLVVSVLGPFHLGHSAADRDFTAKAQLSNLSGR